MMSMLLVHFNDPQTDPCSSTSLPTILLVKWLLTFTATFAVLFPKKIRFSMSLLSPHSKRALVVDCSNNLLKHF